MKEERSSSQILFGFLPEQTVDLQKHVWKVKYWRHPIRRTGIDESTLRQELIRHSGAWEATSKDGGFTGDLRRNADIRVYSVDKENGVEVELFPRVWMCKQCDRLRPTLDAKCKCGSTKHAGQLHFVGYCSECGRIEAPWVPRCKAHDDVAIRLPGTASAAEIKFQCPVCKVVLREGFGFPNCQCGRGRLNFNVHRASSVFTPRSVVLVNPPSRQKIREITEAGGPSRALAWVVNGMRGRNMRDMPGTKASLRKTLEGQGLSREAIEQMIEAADSSGNLAEDDADVDLPADRIGDAEDQAVKIALAMTESRVRLQDLQEGAPAGPLGKLYGTEYPKAFERAGLEAIELVDKFPVLTGNFGFTRGDPTPGASRLRAFRHRTGAYEVFADIAETEALFVRLDPLAVASWLADRGVRLQDSSTPLVARRSILEVAKAPEVGEDLPRESPGGLLLTLVHSYAHRFTRQAAVFAGIDRNALSELLVPLHLGFFVYAAARGDFVLGGLQAVFETELDSLVRAVALEDLRCPLDPGCSRAGGACMACLHLGEPSCRFYNQYLSRSALIGPEGYFTAVRKSEARAI